MNVRQLAFKGEQRWDNLQTFAYHQILMFTVLNGMKID